MQFCIDKLPKDLMEGTKKIANKFSIEISACGVPIKFEKVNENKLTAKLTAKEFFISAPTATAFYRAIGIYLRDKKSEFSVTEDIKFNTNGVMFDCSRNGVLKLSRIKEILKTMAVMGQNTFMLYMEDTYEIKGEPKFGYLRGRYTEEELREIDDYAYGLGIEVVPCIQTLAHLNAFLKWRKDLCDIDDILLIGDEKVNELIDNMFKTFRKTLRTKRIHIGMDEAFHLGRGIYLDKNGYTPKGEIIKKQLNIVVNIAKKYGYSLMMWDDMFFSNSSGEANAATQKPEEVSLVYWKYDNHTEKYYEQEIKERLAIDKNTLFAGGIWRWSGLAPRYSISIAANNAALTACTKEGIKNAFVTVWGDDGSGTPIESAVLGMAMYAEYGFGHTKENSAYEKWVELILKTDINTVMMQEKFDTYFLSDPTLTAFPQVCTLYTDILLGAYDKQLEVISKDNPTEKFDTLYNYFKEKAKSEKYEYIKLSHVFYMELAEVLKYKWNLGLMLAKAYKNGDAEEMQRILTSNIKPLVAALQKFRKSFCKKWLADFKPHGMEVLDGRLGILEARAKTAEDLVTRYISGDADAKEALATLADERIFVDKEYPYIYSAGVMYTGVPFHGNCIY